MSAIITPGQITEEACMKEVSAVLAKYGFKFDMYCLIKAGGMQLGINLAPSNTAKVIPINGGADG